MHGSDAANPAQAPAEGRKLFPEERRAIVLDLLATTPKVLVADLADRFGVSTFTVRADLDELEREGKLTRCHGGAMAVGKTAFVEEYEKRFAQNRASKQRIGELSARLVEPGDSIIVDTGTTTIELVRCLAGISDLTLLTSDLEIASLAEKTLPHANVFFLGGYVRAGLRYTYGTAVLRMLEPFNVDKAFVSANAFSVDRGFTSESVEQAEIKAAYMAHARERFILADSSKAGHVALSSFAYAEDIDGLVTERALEPALAAALRERNKDIRLICQ